MAATMKVEAMAEISALRQNAPDINTHTQRDIEALRQDVANAVTQTHREGKVVRQEARNQRQEVQKNAGMNPQDMEAFRLEIREQTQRDMEALRQEVSNVMQREIKVFRQESRRLRQEALGVATLRQEWEDVKMNLCTLSDRMKMVAEQANVPPRTTMGTGLCTRRKIRDACWGISFPLAMTLCAVFGFGIGITLS